MSIKEEFEKAVREFDAECSEHFQQIYERLDKIKEISEQTGVPFDFELGDVSRQYIPVKFVQIKYELNDELDKLDPDLDPCSYYEDVIGFYPNTADGYHKGGDWEHWNTSSLTC